MQYINFILGYEKIEPENNEIEDRMKNICKREVDFITTVNIIERDLAGRTKNMEKKEQDFERKLNKMKTVCEFDKIVKLNVGGILYETTIETLTKYDSFLSFMFSGKFDLNINNDGYIFIDRDGDIFSHILTFLRSGYIPQDLSIDMKNRLDLEFKYFEIDIDFI